MTSGIDELEALLAALRLYFLTSFSATSSPEALRQSIAVFRTALRAQGIVLASPSPTVTHMQKPDDGKHHDFVNAGEPTSATSTTCGDDDRIDVSQLAKRMDLVNDELRQGTDHIRELVQSVEELKKEVRDLRSAVVAPKSLASSEDHPPPSPPAIDTVEKYAILTTVNQAQVKPSPSPSAVGGSRSTRSPHATEVTELSTSLCPVAIPTPAQTLNTVPINPLDSSRPPSPVPAPVHTPEAIPVSLESPQPALSDIEPKDCTDQTVPRLTDKKGATRTDECETHAPNDEGKMKAEDAKASEDSVMTGSRPKSPVITTANRSFFTGNEGDLEFDLNAKIIILDHMTAPVGWMYGETTETRRGIFLARYVREVSRLDIKDESSNDHIAANSEIKPGSPAIVEAVDSYSNMWDRNELRFSEGDKIRVLDSPDTPAGWMYGEIVERRRGIFPARFATLE